MARYIDADVLHIQMQDLYEHHIEMHNFSADGAVADCLDLLDNAPTADVVEVKHGEWIPIVIQDGYYEPPYCDTIKCSECGALEDVSLHDAKYCHMCGAKMDGKDINVTTTRGNENGNKQ